MANRKKSGGITRLRRAVIRAASPMAQKLMEPPKLESVKRALFIQPHPDDNQIGAGGTIAMLVDRGVEVWELTVLDDRFTSLTYSGEGLSPRQREALAAQACLGMKNAGFLGFGDRTKAPMREIADAITPVIRGIRPDAVFTVDPNLENECHEDHVKVARAVQTAVMDAQFAFLPEYADGKPREDIWRVGTLGFYYTDKPNTVVDISDYEEKKFEAMRCHASQMSPGLQTGIRLLSQQLAMGTAYGCAEALRMISALQMHCFHLPVGYFEA
ncbi:MAG: PIG-L family deacetylase [Oscillospiraceae bacterium]|nr:PIG-L family deacetylase [Oscillospiraceae bacterium]